jgi:hypothetical protein
VIAGEQDAEFSAHSKKGRRESPEPLAPRRRSILLRVLECTIVDMNAFHLKYEPASMVQV